MSRLRSPNFIGMEQNSPEDQPENPVVKEGFWIEHLRSKYQDTINEYLRDDMTTANRERILHAELKNPKTMREVWNLVRFMTFGSDTFNINYPAEIKKTRDPELDDQLNKCDSVDDIISLANEIKENQIKNHRIAWASAFGVPHFWDEFDVEKHWGIDRYNHDESESWNGFFTHTLNFCNFFGYQPDYSPWLLILFLIPATIFNIAVMAFKTTRMVLKLIAELPLAFFAETFYFLADKVFDNPLARGLAGFVWFLIKIPHFAVRAVIDPGNNYEDSYAAGYYYADSRIAAFAFGAFSWLTSIGLSVVIGHYVSVAILGAEHVMAVADKAVNLPVIGDMLNKGATALEAITNFFHITGVTSWVLPAAGFWWGALGAPFQFASRVYDKMVGWFHRPKQELPEIYESSDLVLHNLGLNCVLGESFANDLLADFMLTYRDGKPLFSSSCSKKTDGEYTRILPHNSDVDALPSSDSEDSSERPSLRSGYHSE